ncbi:MAG: chorismate synthase [Deltaproteobacteria bacterium]|nr:chorismate synthase [Deltaproteobacteria bacterium]
MRYFTAGESHGPGLTAILEGMPSHVPLNLSQINQQLARRQQGYGRGDRMKIESDSVRITSGVRHGKTLGSPIALWIENKDHAAWADEMSPVAVRGFQSKRCIFYPRPGHADLNGGLKYDHTDLRNVLERASARETAVRVAVGALCLQFISTFNVSVTAHVIQIGGVGISKGRPDFSVINQKQQKSPVRCIDDAASKKMMAVIDKAKKAGDSVGGIFEVIFSGIPTGLGSHVQADRKLDAIMARTVMSIQAVKGVEIGMGFLAAELLGSKVHDGIYYDRKNKKFRRRTNNAGGFEGGMTTGENIVIRGVMKPISTLLKPLESVDVHTKKTCRASVERSDICAVPAAAVVAENILCIDVASAILEKFGGDSLKEVLKNYGAYCKYLSTCYPARHK